ncbi:alpha-1,2-mannosidase, putative subfamily [Dactylonectria macrodidyma]|uniref:Alpha-1,2-mannosidase, putative subfamily n=1 Tax=Dactylonectria macrodidyma TaxID=307937 RepID=A0A9P9FB22_9HYPO|nr:alpha-1,2-mannosidase, putative subfamily [Dactylonectria macrodidyma]
MISPWLKLLPLVGLLIQSSVQEDSEQDVIDYVWPLIGTAGGGNVFPGATLPFGMAKAVADTSSHSQGGFGSDVSTIIGFSHTHESGTGGAPGLGSFPFLPVPGCPEDDVTQCQFDQEARAAPIISDSFEAKPGYFAVTLESDIHAEVTVTSHTALYGFTFPNKPVNESLPVSPLILFESEDLGGTRYESTIEVTEDDVFKVYGSFTASFGTGQFAAYMCADFQGAPVRDSGVWQQNVPSTEKTLSVSTSKISAGGWIRFDQPEGGEILLRVGLSYLSADQACVNAQNEVPDFDFDKVVQDAKDAWREKLDVVKIEPGGASETLVRTFWSGIYRTMVGPQNYTGENPLWTSDEPYYDSFYCIWDTFRTSHPLLTILDPDTQAEAVRALIDIWRHTGYLPDCRMSFCKGWTQGGSNADVLLADSFIKNITKGIDWEDGYKAVVNDAEVEAWWWDIEGRGHVEYWKTIGYVPRGVSSTKGQGILTRSVSRSVEYAYDDFAIAQMAKGLGYTDDYTKYIGRSGNWANLLKKNQTSSIAGEDTGFVGFLQPRLRDGTWYAQDPIQCSPLLGFHDCYLTRLGGETYEASLWLYTFYVPGDTASLISVLGGDEEFVKRLDFLHESGLLYIGNEPAFLTLFQYHYARRPGLSAVRARQYIPSQFNDTLSGLPGNDDNGAMASFTVFIMMGLFPNAGQDVYFITPPFFESISIKNKITGKTATIRNANFDPEGEKIFIQSATLNGEPYTRNWLQHSFFLEGGVLELVLGSKESEWGTRPDDVPPSLGPFNGTVALP